jgi:hypothetical protein
MNNKFMQKSLIIFVNKINNQENNLRETLKHFHRNLNM